MTILFRFFLFILLLLLTPVLQVAQAYDSPDFDFEIFDRDALRLSANDRETIVEVLNAVVCNFPESDLIDEDYPPTRKRKCASRESTAKTPRC